MAIIKTIHDADALLLYRVGPVYCCAPTMPVVSVQMPPKLNHPPGSHAAEPGIFKASIGMVRVVDLRKRFGVDEEDWETPGRLVVVEVEGGLAGFWVDEIVDVVQYPATGWGRAPVLVPGHVFSRTLMLNDHINLYADFENLNKFRETGYLRQHILLLKMQQQKDDAVSTNEAAPKTASVSFAEESKSTLSQQLESPSVPTAESVPDAEKAEHVVQQNQRSTSDSERDDVERDKPVKQDEVAKMPGRDEGHVDLEFRAPGATTNSSLKTQSDSINPKPPVVDREHMTPVNRKPVAVKDQHTAPPVHVRPASATMGAGLSSSANSVVLQNAKRAGHPVSDSANKNENLHAEFIDKNIRSKPADENQGTSVSGPAVVAGLFATLVVFAVAMYYVQSIIFVPSEPDARFTERRPIVSDPEPVDPPESQMESVSISELGSEVDPVTPPASLSQFPSVDSDASTVPEISQQDIPDSGVSNNENQHDQAGVNEEIVSAGPAPAYRADIGADEEGLVIVLNQPQQEAEDTLLVTQEHIDEAEDTGQTETQSTSITQQAKQQEVVAEDSVSPVVEVVLEEVKETEIEAASNTQSPNQLAERKPLKTSAQAPSQVIIHNVVKGDTLWHIAKKYINNPYRYPELARLSKIKNPDLIYPGDKVKIVVNHSK